jgi:hypothetical protein
MQWEDACSSTPPLNTPGPGVFAFEKCIQNAREEVERWIPEGDWLQRNARDKSRALLKDYRERGKWLGIDPNVSSVVLKASPDFDIEFGAPPVAEVQLMQAIERHFIDVQNDIVRHNVHPSTWRIGENETHKVSADEGAANHDQSQPRTDIVDGIDFPGNDAHGAAPHLLGCDVTSASR